MAADASAETGGYVLDDQIGFILRKANQRHRTIFSSLTEVAPAQFAALAKLYSDGSTSQNHLGRLTAMDGATIKGVVERLASQGLVSTRSDPDDARRVLVELTDTGWETTEALIPVAHAITAATLEPLDRTERRVLHDILAKLAG